jgi:hypothetical protein
MLRRFWGSVWVVTVLAFMLATLASAQTPDQRVIFSFNQPVTLPGKTLPAGKYLFRIHDSLANRHVVQVFSEDGRQIYATFLTIPAQRVAPSSEPEIRFMETAENTPAAIKTWWYPGNTIGHEFIYPKEQALRLARAASQPVLTTHTATTDKSTTEEIRSADLARVSASGSESAVTAEAKPAATTPSGTAQEGQLASSTIKLPESAVPPSPTATTGSQTTSSVAPAQTASTSAASSNQSAPATTPAVPKRTKLPKTATSLPLVGAIGSALLAMGLGLWTWRAPRSS